MAIRLLPSPPPAQSDSSDTSLNHSPHISQDLPVSPHPTDGIHKAQIPSNNSHSCPLYGASRLPLVECISNSRMEAPLISSETLPCSESAGTPKQYSPQALHPTSTKTSRSQTFYNLGKAPVSKSLGPGLHSSPPSISTDIAKVEPESNMGLGSAILLSNSTLLSQDAHEAHQQVVSRPDMRALLTMSPSIPVASIPIDRWPEFAQGILPFLDLTDERILNALPYFRRAGYTHIHAMAYILEKYLEGGTVTRGRRIDKPTRQDYTANSESTNKKFIMPGNCVTPGSLHIRQEQDIGRSSNSYALIPGRGQNFVTRKLRATSVGVGCTGESMSPLHPGIERPNVAIQRLRAETLRLEQAAPEENSQHYRGPYPPTDASHRAFSMHSRLIATRDRALQRRSKSGVQPGKF